VERDNLVLAEVTALAIGDVALGGPPDRRG
jgi:hypothetical protein